MKTLKTTILAGLLLGALPGLARAQYDLEAAHDEARARGELSPGTHAPSRAAMMTTLSRGAPGAIQAVLEYGERVECHECVPVVEGYLLEHDSALVREMSAWWLRRRLFAIGAIAHRMRATLASDPDPVRRGRAAAALGEFLDPHALDPLTVAASSDASAVVRAAAVRALGRLNHPASHGVVASALEDVDLDVRRAALDVALRLNFFHEDEALIGALDDADAEIRMRAARILGEQRVADASPALAAMLAGDVSRDVRQAAAWALGRIGGEEAAAALSAALGAEQDSLVLDAIRVAIAM
jgi:hypothetical protein